MSLPASYRRVVPLLAVMAGLMLALAGQASAAVITVNLAGSNTGTVTSVPAGINCSNTGGGPAGPVCSFNFTALSTPQLTATGDLPGIFQSWSGNGFSSTCNSGSVNPCSLSGALAATITATFGPPPDPPVVSTDPATEVRPYSAQLKGKVNPGGFAVSSCRFEYGTTTDYGKTVPCQPGSLGTGTDDVTVTGYPKGLDPDTTYHYRVVAANVGGTDEGDDQTLTTNPAPDDDCPNAAIRAQQRVELPFCMALEMVTPPEKLNLKTYFSSIGADEEHVKFSSLADLGGTPGIANTVGDAYVSTRGPQGWTTISTTTPAEYGRGNHGSPQYFNADYTRWTAFASTESETIVGIMTQFDGGVGMDMLKRAPILTPISSYYSPTQGSKRTIEQFEASGASADLSRIFFRPGGATRYAPDDPTIPPASSTTDKFLFVSALQPDGTRPVTLFTRDAGGHVIGGGCEDQNIGGGIDINTSEVQGSLQQGAISASGERVYFTGRPGQSDKATCDASMHRYRVMKRLETPDGVQISQLVTGECTRVAPACDTTNGDDLYQAASADGTKVLFTTNRQLADSDLDIGGAACSRTLGASAGCDLYLFDSTLPAGHRLIQVSAGDATDATPGAGANLLSSVTAVSGDGSHVYFVAQDVLTTDTNPRGLSAVAGQPNLYAYQRDAEHPGGETSFVATVAAGDQGTLFGSEEPMMRTGVAAVPYYGGAAGGDGHVLVFDSVAALTADDGDGARRDTFRYDADADTLERVSKAAPGGSDNGPFDINVHGASRDVTADFIESARWVSEDGRSVVFASPEGLADGNANPKSSVFLWRDGVLAELPGDGSSGKFVDGSFQLDSPVISQSGDMVAFGSFDKQLPQDGDITRDIYVARVDGGFPFVEAEEPCDSLAGGCQDAGQAPLDTSSSTGSGGGNADPGDRAQFSASALSRAQRAALAGGRKVRIRVRVSAAGRIAVRGTARVGGRQRQVIAARRSLNRAQTVSLVVRLSRSARRQLARSGRLAVRLTVAFSKSPRRVVSTLALTRRTAASGRGGAR